MEKKKFRRIIFSVLIVLVVCAIWFIKNNPFETKIAASDDATFTLEATDLDLEALKENDMPIIINFVSDMCSACHSMAPDFEAVNEEMQGKAIIKSLNIQQYPDALGSIPVSVVPTQLFISADGTPYVPSEDLGIEFIRYNNRSSGEHIYTMHQGTLTKDQLLSVLDDMGVD